MNVYVNDSFTGYWPVGTSAIIIAKDQATAKRLLEEELKAKGLPQTIDEDTFNLVDLEFEQALIINDGNY